MKVFVSLEHRFDRTPDGTFWTNAGFTYSFWQRYLEVFDEVCIIARVNDVVELAKDVRRADGKAVYFLPLPHYVGPLQYSTKVHHISSIAKQVAKNKDAVILRASSPIANLLSPKLKKYKHPYAVEVLGDPYDVFAPNVVEHPLRPFFRWWLPRQLRDQCWNAMAVSYVTRYALQKRYPAGKSTFSTWFSDVDLPNSAFVEKPRIFDKKSDAFNLVLVGSLEQLYKAPDILIDAIHKCVNSGLKICLTIIGGGKYQAELEARVRLLNLQQQICFAGQVPSGHAIRSYLDKADLFVLPSRTEGLPRALIEAMARALPCIGSAVGGIPELLIDDDLVTPGCVDDLAEKIRQVVTDVNRMSAMSQRNLQKSIVYKDDFLHAKRLEFYNYIRGETEKWARSVQK